MVDEEVIRERLKALDQYSTELRKYQDLTLKELMSELGELWKIEHGLQLVAECILDIGNHIITEYRLGHPKVYRDIIQLLGDNKVIPSKFAQEMEGIAGFRNILIHEYMKVDISKVYQYLQKGPDQFEKFAQHIYEYLNMSK